MEVSLNHGSVLREDEDKGMLTFLLWKLYHFKAPEQCIFIVLNVPSGTHITQMFLKTNHFLRWVMRLMRGLKHVCFGGDVATPQEIHTLWAL